LRTAAGFFEPTLSVQYTNYNLQQTSNENHLSRTVPTFSLNSGLFFERDSQIFNTDFIQTLEPQLYYVYVPYKNQTAFPVFDTSTYAFNVNQSFADYRFNSIDRIGDDNRLTAALATRFIDQKNGQESFMARIGQIYYFSDRKVQLPAVADETTSHSHVIAELKTQLHAYGDWSLSSQAEWDPDLKQNVVSSNQFNYTHNKFNFDVAHRYQLNALETREVKMDWTVTPSWQLLINHLYDIRNDHIVENLLGINYESCCWGLQLSTKERYISSIQTDRGIYLKLILKGLGGFGN
jgi:LPS-assembly protein